MEREKPRSRKKKRLGVKFWAAVCGGIAVAAAATVIVLYIQTGKQYRTVFFPNTTINGIDASKKTVDEVKQLIASGIDGYTLTIKERGGAEEVISGDEIGLESVFDGSLERLLEEQEPNDWFRHRKATQTFEIDTMIQFSDEKLTGVVEALNCFDETQVVKPQDAVMSEYVSGQGYRVIPAVEGSELDREKVMAGIAEAVNGLQRELSLEELDAYVKPGVPSDDAELLARVQALNKFVNVRVTYTFGDSREVLSGDTIKDWIGIGDDGNAYVSSGAVTEYVKSLASKYDTYNKAKTLNTSYGKTVRITGGSYGWRIDQSAEADELAAIIRSGESQTREPVYKQKAVSHGANDYGSTYVEINLTAQHLFYYKDGSLVVESDFVSGNEAKGWATPAGVYPLTYKQKDAVLKGEDYKTPVDYWMPFNGGIGLHDATWRSSFGGTLYKKGGSHGCVNLPHSVAQKIFENISAGTPVLCYHLEGTESKTTSTPAGKPIQPTTAAPETTAPTTPAATIPAATTASPETTAPSEAPAPKPTESQTAAPTKAPETEASTAAVSPERRDLEYQLGVQGIKRLDRASHDAWRKIRQRDLCCENCQSMKNGPVKICLKLRQIPAGPFLCYRSVHIINNKTISIHVITVLGVSILEYKKGLWVSLKGPVSNENMQPVSGISSR
ncbi:L,D-transpeptidase family protein [Hungatella sp.]|uniref:L,D-transpeptidase family protein n=1 Tax=Hungatella sp. TaxID=2613924 RepID=UPI002A83AFB5|nr:L,D-transpeptidase family protein [Hungatella sp.]